ncbi:hypothetical protein MLD38_032729 [Melastoma candidum]|uniref:Uncharacterized protein n=1 Tax=Melastoma candidum TaxID=119954 RepID=A0ACB9M6Q5_9MYRT|nr:hypothetical protein MLD38_032729 [Melastoma candidum]
MEAVSTSRQKPADVPHNETLQANCTVHLAEVLADPLPLPNSEFETREHLYVVPRHLMRYGVGAISASAHPRYEDSPTFPKRPANYAHMYQDQDGYSRKEEDDGYHYLHRRNNHSRNYELRKTCQGGE